MGLDAGGSGQTLKFLSWQVVCEKWHFRNLSLAMMSRTPSGVKLKAMNSINNSSAPVDSDRPPGRVMWRWEKMTG